MKNSFFFAKRKYAEIIKESGELKVPPVLFNEAVQLVTLEIGGYLLSLLNANLFQRKKEVRAMARYDKVFDKNYDRVADFIRTSDPGTSFAFSYADESGTSEFVSTLSSLSKVYNVDFNSQSFPHILWKIYRQQDGGFALGGKQLGLSPDALLGTIREELVKLDLVVGDMKDAVMAAHGDVVDMIDYLGKMGVSKPLERMPKATIDIPVNLDGWDYWEDLKKKDYSPKSEREAAWLERLTDMYSLSPGEDSDEYGDRGGSFYIHYMTDEERAKDESENIYRAHIRLKGDKEDIIYGTELTQTILRAMSMTSGKNLGEKQLKKKDVDFRRAIPKAWANAEGVSLPEYLIRAGGYDTLLIDINFTNEVGSAAGLYRTGRSIIELFINISSIYINPKESFEKRIITPYGIKEIMNDFKSTLRHEMQHYVQDLMNYVMAFHGKGTAMPGYVKEDLRDPSVTPHGTRRKDHESADVTLLTEKEMGVSPTKDDSRSRIHHPLRDVEYQTRLSDAIEQVKKYRFYKGPLSREQQIRYILGLDRFKYKKESEEQRYLNALRYDLPSTIDFFWSLKDYQPKKWREAASEFIKAVL